MGGLMKAELILELMGRVETPPVRLEWLMTLYARQLELLAGRLSEEEIFQWIALGALIVDARRREGASWDTVQHLLGRLGREPMA